MTRYLKYNEPFTIEASEFKSDNASTRSFYKLHDTPSVNAGPDITTFVLDNKASVKNPGTDMPLEYWFKVVKCGDHSNNDIVKYG